MEPEFFELRNSCRRVSEEHIASVTEDDIQKVLHNFSPQQLRAAMSTFAQQHKFGDVVVHTKPSVMQKALEEANEPASQEKFKLSREVIQSTKNLQCAVFENIDAEFHKMCVDVLGEDPSSVGRQVIPDDVMNAKK